MIEFVYNFPDFTLLYNTKLSRNEEVAFAYDKAIGAYGICYDDMYDYDIKGAWKELADGRMEIGRNNHLGDTYKKPNHPTFSDESIYHCIDSYYGGHWFEIENEAYIFVPGLTNFYPPSSLAHYFESEANCELYDFRYDFFKKKCVNTYAFDRNLNEEYFAFCNELMSRRTQVKILSAYYQQPVNE